MGGEVAEMSLCLCPDFWYEKAFWEGIGTLCKGSIRGSPHIRYIQYLTEPNTLIDTRPPARVTMGITRLARGRYFHKMYTLI